MIKTLPEIRALLANCNVSQCARETGLHRNTLRLIRDGRHANPGYDTIIKLTNWADAQAVDEAKNDG